MATYYLLRKTENSRYLIDYTDEAQKTPRSFTSARTAFRAGMNEYGIDRFEVVKEIPEALIEFEMKDE